MENPVIVLEQVRSVLTEAGAVPLSCWSRDELADWLCGLQDIRAQVDGLVCVAAAEADNAAVPQLDQARSLRRFVAGRTGTNPADVGADLALGRWLRSFATVTDALAAGRITRRHAQALRDMDGPRAHQALLVAQDYLVDAAAGCAWDDFVDVCNRWIANADPDGALPDERTRRRRLTIRRHGDGSLSGHFVLDTIAGDAVKTAVEREALRLFRIDADPTNPEARVRNHAQRMADALVNLITRGAIRRDGTVGAPLVHVVIGNDVLDEAICRSAAADAGVAPIGLDGAPLADDLGIDPSDPLRRCELIDATPVHPNQVVALLGVATIRRLVLDADGEILDLGRSVRDFPRHLREAMLAAGRGRCAEAGCDAPPAWLQADHIVPWSRSGRTATGNGQMLCGAANRAKGDRPDPAAPAATRPPDPPPWPGAQLDPSPPGPTAAASP